ncbi:MAG TPA: hypothetical protein VI197_29820 [Polyangiaceae bacterium]
MQWIRQWLAGTVVACAIAGGASGCGGNSSDDNDNDGDSKDSGSNGTSAGNSGGSGGSNSGSGDSGTGSGDDSSSSSTGNGTGDLVPGTPTEVEDYYGEASGVVCEWLAPCCGALGLEVSVGSCTTTIEARFSADYASADPDNYTYDPDLAGDCLATARALYSDLGCQLQDSAVEIDPSVNETCDRVFEGKLEPGAPCAADIECASQPGEERDCTSLGSDDDATVCVIERRAAEGEACYWTCSQEGSTYYCSGAGVETPAVQGRCYTNDQLYCASGVCARQPALGESCAGNATCHEGYCLNDLCVPAGDTGDPCQSDLECADDLYCDGTACAPKKAEGAACEDSSECESGSCDYDEGTCTGAAGGDFAIALLCAVASGQL